MDQYDSLGATGPASGFSGPRCSPTVAEGKVVTLGVRGVLSCLDASSGKLLWRKDDFQGAWPRFFVSSSPLVAGGLCVAQLGGPNGGGIVAYDLAGGAEKWKWTGDSPAYASPVLMTVGGAKYVVAQTEAKMLALALADGKLAWETPFAVQGRGYNAATPIVDGATLIYAGSGRGAVAVKLEPKDGALAATELWKNPDHSVQFSTPVLKDGWLFGVSARNDVFCLNVADGKTAWAAPFAPADAEPQVQGQGGGPGGGQGGGPGGPGGGRGGRGGGGGRGMAGYASVVDAGSVLLALTPASQLQSGEHLGVRCALDQFTDDVGVQRKHEGLTQSTPPKGRRARDRPGIRMFSNAAKQSSSASACLGSVFAVKLPRPGRWKLMASPESGAPSSLLSKLCPAVSTQGAGQRGARGV